MANFYISDLHIGHENILRFDNRPFADVNEMNNKLIENWNARVHSNDGAADEKLDLCKEGNRCTLMKNGLER